MVDPRPRKVKKAEKFRERLATRPGFAAQVARKETTRERDERHRHELTRHEENEAERRRLRWMRACMEQRMQRLAAEERALRLREEHTEAANKLLSTSLADQVRQDEMRKKNEAKRARMLRTTEQACEERLQELRAKRQAFEVHEREKRVCAIVSDVARCAIAKVLAAARDAERIEQARYQRLQRLYQVGQHLECEDAMYADVLFGSEM
jgi:hypothetical protein